ncbi:hypothetical protein FGO68_gene2288 [Halteria grandinella]|uniref:Uncharacterized protein n=1 Tax=Halteria grandinella TaxID=5974 RepID=A0A8J8SYK1_HALGN|nr:hypothetical protein FGO68_gene2288 [Halteria grandinella]
MQYLSIFKVMLDQLIDQSKMLIIQKMLTLKIEDRPDFKYLFEACVYEQTQITLKSRISPQVLKSLQLKSRALQQSLNEPLKEQSEVTRSINLSHHTPKTQSTKAAYSNQCYFLHERIHIPISPGENYLGSSTPQQKKRKAQIVKRSSSKRKNIIV